MRMRNLTALVVFAFALVTSYAAFSKETKHIKEFGNYVVHFNALPTDFLTTKVAKQHNVTRSRNRIMLNISIKQKALKGPQTAVKAKVIAIATNLSGQIKKAEMRRIHDGKAIYYIGEFNVSDREYLKFRVQLTPDSQKQTYTFNFQKQFFTQ